MELGKLQLCALLLVCVPFLHIVKAVGQAAVLFFVTSYSLIIGSWCTVMLLVTRDTGCCWLLLINKELVLVFLLFSLFIVHIPTDVTGPHVKLENSGWESWEIDISACLDV
jgi:hypothetical protein